MSQVIDIPARIREIRKQLNLSQRELAKKMSVVLKKPITRSKIADYETNRSKIAACDWECIKALAPPDDKRQGAENP